MCFSILSFRAWYGVVCAGSVRLLDAHAVLGSGGTAEPGRSSGDGAALLKLRAGMTHWEIADQQAFGGNGVPSGYLPYPTLYLPYLPTPASNSSLCICSNTTNLERDIHSTGLYLRFLLRA